MSVVLERRVAKHLETLCPHHVLRPMQVSIIDLDFGIDMKISVGTKT